MELSTMVRMAWRNLWRNGRRTVLTLFSIAFGLFLAVLMTAMQDRNWADMIDLAARLGGGHVTVQHEEFRDTPTLDRTVDGVSAIAERALEDPEVTHVSVRVAGQALLSTASSSRGAAFVAVDPRAETPSTLAVLEAIVEGEMFGSSDDPGIVLGARLAENLGVSLGKKVVYNMTDRHGDIIAGLGRVVGIVRTGSPSVDNGLCLLPLNTMRRALGYGPEEATRVAVFIDDQRRSDDVAGRLASAVTPPATALPWHVSQPELAGFIAMKVGGANFMKILVAVLIAAGIFNTLFVSVTERMREFGIMLAIGYSPGDIRTLVMLESFWLGLVGLIVGAALTAGPYLYLHAHGLDMSAIMGEGSVDIAGIGISTVMKVEIFPVNAVIIAVAALAATVAAGAYPAWKAGRVAPVETIRLV
ncbi:MAG: FtsX-like permease family protein [Gemmatimonadota bacterium]